MNECILRTDRVEFNFVPTSSELDLQPQCLHVKKIIQKCRVLHSHLEIQVAKKKVFSQEKGYAMEEKKL